MVVVVEGGAWESVKRRAAFDRLFALMEADLAGPFDCFRCRRGSDRGRWRRNLADGLCQPWLTTSEAFALIHRPSFALMISRSLAQGIWGYAAVAAQVFCLVAFLGRRTDGFLAARAKATCRCLSVCCAPRSPRAPCCARC